MQSDVFLWTVYGDAALGTSGSAATRLPATMHPRCLSSGSHLCRRPKSSGGTPSLSAGSSQELAGPPPEPTEKSEKPIYRTFITVFRIKSLWTGVNPRCDRSPPLQPGGKGVSVHFISFSRRKMCHRTIPYTLSRLCRPCSVLLN
jgi:hypothetical protein